MKSSLQLFILSLTSFFLVIQVSYGFQVTSRAPSGSRHAVVERLAARISADIELGKTPSVVMNNEKPRSRSFKPIGPFGWSRTDTKYLTGAFAHIGRHSATIAAAVGLDSSNTSLSWREKAPAVSFLVGALPRVMSLITGTRQSSLKIHIQEARTIVDNKTGKVDLTALKEAAAERIAYLIMADLKNIRDGIYPIPTELQGRHLVNPKTLGADVIAALKGGKLYQGKPDYAAENGKSAIQQSVYGKELARGLDLPNYYKHDFHSVAGGFMSPEHVAIYDNVSEFAFYGTHRMARRMLLRPIYEEIVRHNGGRKRNTGKGLKLLDLGTGTGSFLVSLQEAFAELELHALDLSPAMIEHAKQLTGETVQLQCGNMEDIPYPNQTFDMITITNCFHELPEAAIKNTATEVARVLKPGGLYLHIDAMQCTDDPNYVAYMHTSFDGRYYEPYMKDWVYRVDMDSIMGSAGLVPVLTPHTYLASTVRCYRKQC